MKRQVFITFDLDLRDHVLHEELDEFEQCFDRILSHLSQRGLPATWFVRIDGQIEGVNGEADHFLRKHSKRIELLKEKGHELGWHHHAFRQENGKWVPEVDVEKVCADLQAYGEIAKRYGMRSCRMGWGFQNGRTLQVLEALGFDRDSSAIPRPSYPWDNGLKDWSKTTNTPYYPSKQDYRVPGDPHHSILEVPISTFPIPKATDDRPSVMRYLDPAYFHEAFKNVLETMEWDRLVLICHPYELLPHQKDDPLLSFSEKEFEKNLDQLMEVSDCFSTISEAV